MSSEQKKPSRPHEDTVVVRVVPNDLEAELAQDALEEAGIPCVIESHADAALDGVVTAQKGRASVRVPREMAERAARIVEEALEPIDEDSEEGIPDVDALDEEDSDDF